MTNCITRNYHAHGGSEWVIGGKLTFLPGATVEGADFNALLLALREAGLMRESSGDAP